MITPVIPKWSLPRGPIRVADPDSYPGYDIAFDPVNNAYKVPSGRSSTVAGFLALSGVSYSADPTAGFSASGFRPASTYHLEIAMPPGSSFSFYAVVDATSDGNYCTILSPYVSGGEITFPAIVREAFSLQARTGCIVAGVSKGTDTNMAAMTATGEMIGMTVSPTNIKYYINNTKGVDLAETGFATHLLDRFPIGDGMTGHATAYNADIKLLLVKFLEDSEAAAAAWTNN